MAVSEFAGKGEVPQRLQWTRPVLEDLGDLGSVLGGPNMLGFDTATSGEMGGLTS
jgi:hypothetical protein